ncbi:RB1-inducible coiled-coil protein 1 isoform X2 [Hermetia illucens]|uniref:RB1-inducible coiled-coil protein 1 isoform X2 n=1 Tax=Hermetia illucens TaxID=343691 RepID=UPI0018CC2860|nr:RB1-inducible coiled-coil protein 1 isoform X2 [Hermetia illucens]
MLYVFHVDCGRMMKFDMNMALSKVENLKHTIELLHGFSAAHQVLLVSGGEMLQPGSMVCSYSAGTDTNPIYMFTTEDPVDSKNNKIPWPSIEPIVLDVDLKDQVERCLALPATYATVVQRAQLSQQIFDLAREEESICERLVHEQHLQQQGWSAVIANMEDLVTDFKERYKHFTEAFEVYMGQRGALCEALKTFEIDVEVLGRIPVLPNLLKGVEYDSHGFDEISEKDVSEEVSHSRNEELLAMARAKTVSKSEELAVVKSEQENRSLKSEGSLSHSSQLQISLLQWMSLKDNHLALKSMSEECLRGMEMLEDRKVQLLRTDIANILKMAEQEEIKEIKGLEDRLCGLEKLMFDLKKIVQEQRELATAFQQNQNRASNLGDPSILPDLCASHRSQLLVMLQSQRKIRDIRRRISKAKEELSDNLYKRLKYIVHIENTMLELANNLLFYHRCLRRIDSHLSVIKQIHEAPTIYVTAVMEVVQRRSYSTAFSSWASSLASDLLNIYKDEITRRQEFDIMFRGHFLGSLFPGLTDMPPEFATEIPAPFDECLPDLTKNDLETLSTYMPDITSNFPLSPVNPVIEFFNSRSGNRSTQDKSCLSGKLQSIEGPQVLPRPIDIYSHLKDGFESETDTEEFEKVGQSPNERKLSAAATAVTIATSTSQLKVETVTISTTTERVEMQTAQTSTEMKKKSSRLNTLPISSRTNELMLPAIPESDSTETSPHSLTQFEDSRRSPDPLQNPSTNTFPLLLGHQHPQQHLHTQQGPSRSPSSPSNQAANNVLLIDNEFINSEFYIDESLPSSLKGDNGYSEDGDSDSFDRHCGDEEYENNQNVDTSFSYQYKNRSEDNSCPLDASLTNNSRESLETVISLLQDNLGSTTLEVERLKALLKSMSQLSLEALTLLRSEMQRTKCETESCNREMQDEIKHLHERWFTMKSECEAKEAENNRLIAEQHDMAIKELCSTLKKKQDEFITLEGNYKELETKLTKDAEEFETREITLKEEIARMNARICELETQLQNAEIEKERAVADCRDKIIHEHKTEIESLRCRFKLMTNMERSPSDISLEKIERPDVIDIMSHESIIQQLREDFENEKTRAIEAAIEKERLKWAENQKSASSSSISPDAFRKIIEEKERQLDVMRERDLILSKENAQLKVKIEALANEEESDRVYLKDQIDILNRDKVRMESELRAEKMRRLEMESSVATMKLSTCRDLEGGSTSRSKPTTSSQSPLKLGVQIDSCNRGDTIFVVWNNRHGQYIIVQDSATLYFLHSDSHSALNLKAPSCTISDFPEPYYCVGRVVDKEYCHARKDENRYKVSKGTKFYRVRVQPIIKSESSRHSRRERNESTSSASSVAVSRSTSTQHLIDSFAQTDTSGICTSASQDMTDSINTRDRTISVTEEDEEQVSLTDRYRCVSLSEEDERTLEGSAIAAATNLPGSQNTTFRSIGIFTLIEPLLSPLQINMDA